jgi:hypothetical protein
LSSLISRTFPPGFRGLQIAVRRSAERQEPEETTACHCGSLKSERNSGSFTSGCSPGMMTGKK